MIAPASSHRFWSLRFWSAKRAAILIGFVLTILGSLGAHFYVDPVQLLRDTIDDRSKTMVAGIATLHTAQSQYLLIEQQGALVFALRDANLAPTDSAARGVIEKLYLLSLADRLDPLRTLIGELAKAGQLDFPATMTRYEALVDAAKNNVTLATYLDVDNFEQSIVARSTALMASVQQVLTGLEQARSSADGTIDSRKMTLLALMTLGSAFLLAANLISTREDKTADDGVAELTTATQLLEIALDHARKEEGEAKA